MGHNISTIETYLRSVARAHELVVGGRPWDDTSQMGAHGIKAEALKGSISLNNKVCGITLQTLGEGVVSGLLLGQVSLLEEFVSKGILGRDSAVSTSGARGEEEKDVWNSKSTDRHGGRSDEDQVHKVSAVCVDVEFAVGSGHADGSDSRGALLHIDRGRSKSGRGADEGGGKDGEKVHGGNILLDEEE